MHHQQEDQAQIPYMENSSDLELYEVNIQQKKLSKKQSNSSSNYQRGDLEDQIQEDMVDDYINIYKDPARSEEYVEEYDEQHNEEEHHHLQNIQDEEDDDDELDEVNGGGNMFQRKEIRYVTQDLTESATPQNYNQNQQNNNIGRRLHDQLQQHNQELEQISNEYQIQTNGSTHINNDDHYEYINEMQEYQPSQQQQQQLNFPQNNRVSSQHSQNRYSQQEDEHNEEPVRLEKQLSKMTPEEAEIEYQNRYQQKLMQLQQKQQSLKNNSESTQIVSSQYQSSNTSNKQHKFMIQSDKTMSKNQQRPPSGNKNKDTKSVVVASQSQKSFTSNQRNSSSQIKEQNSLEHLKTVKSSVMTSSQETYSNNNQQTQPNMQRLSQISETRSQDSQFFSKNQQNSTQNKVANKTQPAQKQQRPQSSQPKRSEHQVEILSNLYYQGMQIKNEKEQKLKMMKKENEERAMNKCTFQPKLTEKANRLSEQKNNYLAIEDKTQIFMKRKQILIERGIEEKKRIEVQGCTFTPKVNPKKFKSLPTDEQHNMSVYDRQVEWQKKVQDKNNERMKNAYVSVMTPSKKSESQTRNSSQQNRSKVNNNSAITNSVKRMKQAEKGFYSEKRISNTFLTYLNCKYDYVHQSNIDSSKNIESPQILLAKPQEMDILQKEYYNEGTENYENEHIRIQNALEVCQTLGANQQIEGRQSGQQHHPHEYTFGHLNQQPASSAQKQAQQSTRKKSIDQKQQPKIIQQKTPSSQKTNFVDNYQLNKSVQGLKYKKAPPASIDLIKQMVNKSLQDQFQSSKSMSKSSSSAQIAKQYSYLNTLPKKVNFSSVSKLQNVVVSKNQYTLHDPTSQQDIQEFYSAKQSIANTYYQQYQEKQSQSHNKTVTANFPQQESQFFSQRKASNNNNHHALFEQAYKINKEIKQLNGQVLKENLLEYVQPNEEYQLE